jgi:hypothetical protein
VIGGICTGSGSAPGAVSGPSGLARHRPLPASPRDGRVTGGVRFARLQCPSRAA